MGQDRLHNLIKGKHVAVDYPHLTTVTNNKTQLFCVDTQRHSHCHTHAASLPPVSGRRTATFVGYVVVGLRTIIYGDAHGGPSRGRVALHIAASHTCSFAVGNLHCAGGMCVREDCLQSGRHSLPVTQPMSNVRRNTTYN